MATIEMNALSVITCGSISVRVFLPEMDKLALDDVNHEKKYPVLWLLHNEGGAALDWLETPAERMAKKYGIFIIAPDQHHAMCTDMAYGPRYEQFMNTELPGICRNNLPISADPALNWIGGVGTGAYGAVKMGLKYPQIFSKVITMNGIVDMQAVIDKALADKDTGITQNKASLEAAFGDLSAFGGSANDIFALAKKTVDTHFLLQCEKNSPTVSENERLADSLNRHAVYMQIPTDADLESCQYSLPQAVKWLCENR